MSDDAYPIDVHLVTVLVVDHDELGKDGVRNEMANVRYPNYCLTPRVLDVKTKRVDWHDEHQLNRSGSAGAARELFGDAQSDALDEVRAENELLRAALRELMRAGSQASNVCFNLRQVPGRELTHRDCDSMTTAYRVWDKECGKARELLRGSQG